MSIFWNSKTKHIQQLQQQPTPSGEGVPQPQQRSRQRKQKPTKQQQPQTRQQQAQTLLKSHSQSHNHHQQHSSTTNIQVPETNLTSVLYALMNIVKKELTQPPQRALFVPPKHLGYAGASGQSDGTSQDTKYYPLSVRAEDTNTYFRDQEHEEIEKIDRDGRKVVLQKVPFSVADNQRYPFDRSAGNYIHNALHEEEEKKKKEQRQVESVSKSKEQITALRSEGLWIKQQKQNMEHRIKRLEHLLSLIQDEQKKEIDREKQILQGARKSSTQMDQLRNESLMKTGPNKNVAHQDTGSIQEHRQIVANVHAERADTADRLMRILQDYDLVSGAEMATYLMKSLHNVALAPQKAERTFVSSLSGITNPDNLPNNRGTTSAGSTLSSSSSSSSSSSNGTGNGSTLLSLSIRKKSDTNIPAAGLGSDLMRTPRGRYAPVTTDSNTGIVTHIGFGGKPKSTRSNSRSSSALTNTSGNSNTAMHTSTVHEEALHMVHANRVNMPEGPMSRRGRALMYRNYRSLLVQEAGAAGGIAASGGGGGGGGGSRVGTSGTRLGSSNSSNSGSSFTPTMAGSTASTRVSTNTATSGGTATTTIRRKRLTDLEPNWYPHMGTMPAPVGVAERALRNPDDPKAGKRDGRGLPPEEMLPDDDQPFEGRVRWFAKKNDLNFYPMLTAPSFSRSFAADKIIRKMLEQDKTPKEMTGMPAYRLSMPMAGAKTYGESSNSFSFLLGRPLQPLQ